MFMALLAPYTAYAGRKDHVVNYYMSGPADWEVNCRPVTHGSPLLGFMEHVAKYPQCWDAHIANFGGYE